MHEGGYIILVWNSVEANGTLNGLRFHSEPSDPESPPVNWWRQERMMTPLLIDAKHGLRQKYGENWRLVWT